MASKHNLNGDFEAFVKDQQPTASEDERLNWENERDEWLLHLKELYKEIELFLKKYIDSGEIKCDYRSIRLNEENIGSYTARQMVLKIGRSEITLTPVGTLIAFSKGRVDVVGPAGQTRFMLVNKETSRPRIKVTMSVGRKPGMQPQETNLKEVEWVWKIVTSPPSVQYVELTQESLFQALMEIANG
jgi:hypothetical protein